jgi:hypothetical protein
VLPAIYRRWPKLSRRRWNVGFIQKAALRPRSVLVAASVVAVGGECEMHASNDSYRKLLRWDRMGQERTATVGTNSTMVPIVAIISQQSPGHRKCGLLL